MVVGIADHSNCLSITFRVCLQDPSAEPAGTIFSSLYLFTTFAHIDLNMSEPIPEAIPTSYDSRSQRPAKRQALTPRSQQASQVDALFANPDREIRIPDGTKARTLAPPPEIVTNVQGSSAGAGSGEFHVYKASRRREQERVKAMEEEIRKEKDIAEFEQQREEQEAKESKRSSKNKARRDKAKARKASKDNDGSTGSKEGVLNGSEAKKGIAREADSASPRANGDGDELVKRANTEIGVVIHDDD